MKQRYIVKLNRLIIFVCAVFVLFSFVACNSDEQPQDVEHQHTYSQTVVEPTCQERGYTLFTCECGYSVKKNYTEKVDHKYINGKCKYCSTLETFEIIYVDGKNQPNGNPTSFTVEDEVKIENLNDIEGLRFGGWYNENGNLVTKINIGTTKSIKLTAKWLPNVNLNKIKFEDATFVYDGKPHSIEVDNVGLPSNCVIEYIDNVATNAGEYVATAQFYVEGVYAGQKTANLTIEKAKFDFGETCLPSQTFVYDGKPKKLTVSNLPAGAKLTYYNQTATDVGEHTVKAVVSYDDGNKFGELVLNSTLTITKATYDMENVVFADKTVTYDGRTKSILPSGLPKGVKVNYDFNSYVDAGEYLITATFVGDEKNYYPILPKTATLTILRADFDLNAVSYSFAPCDYYNGEIHNPVASGLPDGVDVSFDDNGKCVDAGDYEMTANFSISNDNYNPIPDQQIKLTIKKATVDMSGVVFANKTVTYDGSVKEITAENLPDCVSVTYSPTSCINAGVYQIVAKFTADAKNYNDIADMSAKLIIAKATYDFSDVIFGETNLVYDGEKKTYSVDNLPDGVNAIYDFEAVNAGVYDFTITFEGDNQNYNKIPNKDVTITINKATVDMSGVSFESRTFTYSGASFKLVATGVPSYVTVSYENNDKIYAGEYEVVAQFSVDTQNYNAIDNMTAILTIEVAEYDVSDIKFENATFVYDGEEKHIYVTSLPADIKVTYSPDTCVEVGEYIITASFEVDENKYAPIADMTATLTIEKATIDMSGVLFEDKTFGYDGQAKNLEIDNLPKGVSVAFDVCNVVEIGIYRVTATFAVDSTRYHEIAPMSATLEIIKGSYDTSKFKFDDKETVYDGNEQSIEVVGVCDGVIVTYENNCHVSSGEYIIVAHFEVDETHYESIADMSATLTILKATYDMSGVTYQNTTCIYDGTAKSIAVSGLPDGVTATISQTPTSAGVYDVVVSFEKDDENFDEIPDAIVKMTVQKATVDMSGVAFENLSTVYDGEEKTVLVSNLPSGVTVSYVNNSATNAGTYSAIATFTAPNENYNSIPSKIATLTIQKRRINANIVGERNIVYDGKSHKELSATFENVIQGDTIGYQFAYSGDMIEIGDYTASISISNDNYALTGTTSCALTIYMAHYFDCVFADTENFLYVVGNGNNIALSSLFKAAENAEINSEDVTVSVSAITGNVTCTVTRNTTTWTSGTLKFVNTGIVLVSISQQGRGELILNLEIVSAKNATKYSDISGSVVFLNDIEMPDNGTRSFSNATVYGNGFTFDVTKGKNSNANGIVSLANSHINNLKIIAAVYPELSMSVNTAYFSSAIQTTGTSSITNCYVANARFCVRAFSGNLTIKDTIFDGGRYGNLFITGGTVNVNNLTTINMPRDGVCGIGILFDNSGTNDMRLNISGDFKQYNWLAKNEDKQYFENTDIMASFFDKIFGSGYSDIQFSYNGDTYVNACICSLKDGLSASAVSGLPSYYKYYDVSALGMNGFVVANDKTKYTLNMSSFALPDYQSERVPSKVSYTYTGATLNASGNIPVSYNKGDNFEFDLNVLTAKKFGYNLSVMPTVNGVEYASGKIVLNATNSYKFDIVFKVIDTYVFGADGVQITPVVYDVVYTVEVNVIKNIPTPTFTFKDKDGKTYSATTVTVGNETYIVPDADTGYSQTVGGVKINCVLVEGNRVLKWRENTVYHYFPFFNGVTIQDYDEDGNVVTTINSSTTTQPETIDVISKNGNTGSTTNSLSQLTATKYDNKLCLEGYGSGSTESNKTVTTVYFKYKYTANNGNVYYYYVAYNMGEPKTVLF